MSHHQTNEAASSRFYLASQSARRQELLNQIGAHFDVLRMRTNPERGVDVSELPISGEPPEQYVRRIAREKAQMGLVVLEKRGLPLRPVLGADTIVELDGQVLGKPSSAAEAATHLQRLSGRIHHVHTSVSLTWLTPEGPCHVQDTVTSEVCFRQITAAETQAYVASGEGIDKAGGYAIQGVAAIFIKAISGSYSGIVGLPIFETATLLARAGIFILL